MIHPHLKRVIILAAKLLPGNPQSQEKPLKSLQNTNYLTKKSSFTGSNLDFLPQNP